MPDFALQSRELTARYMRVVAYCLLAGTLGLWPLDFVIYGDDPTMFAAFVEIRAGVTGTSVLTLIALRAMGPRHPLVVPTIVTAMTLNVAMIGHALWPADARFYYTGHALP